MNALDAMSRPAKAAAVAGGYGLAVLAGWAASRAHDAFLAAQPYDTSGGMYAAGVFMSGVIAFLVVALVPTVLALWFLRGSARFWGFLGAGTVAFALAGLTAVLVFMTVPDTRHPAMMFVHLFGLAQLLGVPFWILSFAVFACIAPTRPSRTLLLGAIAVELLIGLCAAFHWFVRSAPR